MKAARFLGSMAPIWLGYRLLHQQLAAAAGPLAADVAVHEELCRHDVQALAHVFAHAHHRLAAIRGRAGGVLGFVMMFDTHQVFGQGLPLGAAPCFNRRRIKRCAGLGLQGFKLRRQAGFVGGQCFLEELALLGVHGLGLGRELPGLQARQLEGDALNLHVAELDGLRLGCDLLALLADALEHLCSHFGQRTRAQTVQVLGFEFMHVEHVRIVQSQHWRGYPGMFGLQRRCFSMPNRICVMSLHHMRVITLICSRRCHGRPTTRASNCACVNVVGAAPAGAWRGHAKRPSFKRLAAHHTPKPSCTSSLIRVARALANR